MTAVKESTAPATAIGRRSLLALGVASASAMVIGGGKAEAAASKGVKVTVLYGAPTSPDDFEKYYIGSHMPKVYKVKGLRKVELAKPMPGPDGKAPAFYRITEIWFSSAAQMQKVAAKDDWKAIVADVPNFATGGATVLVSNIE
jgi:uncharacterized protein (TIGR02118 family)